MSDASTDPSDIYRRSLQAGAGLPSAAYTSVDVFEAEMDRLLRAAWLCIGATQDVAQIGDVCPVSYAGAPLLIVRDDRDDVRVFHNVCAHRGAQLATKPRRCRRHIVCPYHSWAYGLNGKLVGTPNAGGAGKHDLHGLSSPPADLQPVAAATWNGLVFANIDGTAAPFADFIAPIDARIGDLEVSNPRFDTELATSATVSANWKILIENFVESYHLPSVHPELERINPMRDHYQILGGHTYLGQGGLGYRGTEGDGAASLPLRAAADLSRYEVFYIYPNLFFGPVSDFGFVIILNPRAADHTEERLEFMYYGDRAMAHENEGLRTSTAESLRQVNNQDIGICESVQLGRASPAFAGGVFALPQETTSLHFQKLLAARMLGGEDVNPEDIVTLPTRDIFHDNNDRQRA